MKKIIWVVILLVVGFSIYFIIYSKQNNEAPIFFDKVVYHWTITSNPTKTKYFCDTGFIKIDDSFFAPTYKCSDGSRVKSIREITVSCINGYPIYDKSKPKNIPYKCSDNSELIIEKHGYPRIETILCQREGEEPYLEEINIIDPKMERTCKSPGNSKFIDVVDIY